MNVLLSTLSDALEVSLEDTLNYDADAPLSSMGLDSLKFIRWIVLIEEKISREILVEDMIFERFATINTAMETLKKYES